MKINNSDIISIKSSLIIKIITKYAVTQRVQDFLREGAVQSQKSTEELLNMHSSTKWVSWQGITGLLTALIEYLTVLLEYLDLFAI